MALNIHRIMKQSRDLNILSDDPIEEQMSRMSALPGM
jgi:hypothetical protein